MEVGIRELKNSLSHYIDRVRKGETIVITDRGRPVARIHPIASSAIPPALQRLVDAGLAVDKGIFDYVARPIPMLPGDSGKSTTDYVREQRR